MALVKSITANEILDSRGNPTVETTVILDDGSRGIASCPSGASTGTHEAKELRDLDEKRFRGLGVIKAVDNVQNIIGPKLLNTDAANQQEIDRTMIALDATPSKENLGANAVLSVSMAAAKAAANSFKMPLFIYLSQYVKKNNKDFKIPTPLFNLINGGKHANSNLDLQEFMVIPASFKPYRESIQIGTNVYNALKEILKSNNLSTLIGDEGGFSPKLSSNIEAFSLLSSAVSNNQYRLGFDVFFGLDAAASSFYANKSYRIRDKQNNLSAENLISFYQDIQKQFGLLYLEDGLYEDDWEDWAKLCQKMSRNTIITGDDLTVTNPYRLQTALDKKTITGIIIKPNQIGTVIEALAVIEIAKEAGLKIVVSHRSGETNDDFIADFAVAAGADYVKFGAPARGERVAKYNRLMYIEEEIRKMSE